MATRRGSDRDADPDRRTEQRRRYAAGLPDYHDPLAGIGGAPPAQSALTLRLVLAIFGLLFCTGTAVVIALEDGPAGYTIAFAAVAATALIDIVVIVRRKRRGEPG